jgi:protein-tyrosine phosphatase
MASILVVCTGNVCRSPIAAGVLRSELERRFGPDAPEVASAGIGAWERSPATPEAVDAAAERGFDISTHRGRQLARPFVEDADLVVAMATDHSKAVVEAVPEAAAKTFTLKELVRLVEALPAAAVDHQDPGATLAARAAEADRLRGEGFEGAPFDEDVADPIGMPFEMYRAVAWELDEWGRRLVAGVFGPS